MKIKHTYNEQQASFDGDPFDGDYSLSLSEVRCNFVLRHL